MQHVAHMQASWLYEFSPHVRNQTRAEYHYGRATASGTPYNDRILQWMRFYLKTRAFFDAIWHRDWARAFL